MGRKRRKAGSGRARRPLFGGVCGSSDTAHLCHGGTQPPLVVACGNHYSSPMPDPRRLGTRVNLTLPADVMAAVDRMANAGGVGRATLIRELLEGQVPAMLEMARAVELAKQKNLDAFKVVSDVLRDASAQADQMQLNIKQAKRAYQRKLKKP